MNSLDIEESRCSHCDEPAYWYDGKMILPRVTSGQMPHSEMPEDCRADFEEARLIFTDSPRAAGALLRLCLQKLLINLGKNGKNINEDIAAMVREGLPPLIQKSLDICRVVGNNSVHPGEINLVETTETVLSLFSIINFIVEDRIARPRQIQELYEQLPGGALEAIEKRDSKAKK